MTRKVPATSSCNPASLSESMLEIISLHILMRQVLRGRVVSSCVILLGYQVVGTQELTSLVGRLNLVTTYSRRRRNSFAICKKRSCEAITVIYLLAPFARCKKRSCEAITVICLLALETFLSEYEYHYSLIGNNKFVSRHGLEPI